MATMAISHLRGDCLALGFHTPLRGYSTGWARNDRLSAILCLFVRMIARAALLQSFYFGGKENRVMAHPVGFR